MPVGDLEEYRVTSLPNTAYYIPYFISEDDERYLIHRIYTAPKPKWTQLSDRRVQNWGGLPHPRGMIQEPLPDWLQMYVDRIVDLGIFSEHLPNHVLINEYMAGQGIMPHEDGPLFHPLITTITISSHGVLDYYAKRDFSESVDPEKPEGAGGNEGSHIGSLLLERCSLLIVKDDLYTNYLHGIKGIEEDVITTELANVSVIAHDVGTVVPRRTRVSLTIRNVPKVLKTKVQFGQSSLK